MIEILERTPPIPENAQWGLFLRNHDELTLEMVTDEERDYMYEEYAKDPRMKLNLGIRRRLAPLLDGGRPEIELMHAILFSLPGSPVLYYGDEIVMGDNVYLGDRDGVRTPMQWTGDRNGGFSRADFAQLYLPPLMDPVYGYQAVNVEAQLRTPTSFLRWLRRFVELRKQHPVFGLGDYQVLRPENPKIFAHIRSFCEDIVLCVHNLAGSAQAVELDLSRVRRSRPGRDVRPDAVPARSASCPTCSRWRRAASSGSSSWIRPTTSDLKSRIESGDLPFLDGLVLLGDDRLPALVRRRSPRTCSTLASLDATASARRAADPLDRDRRSALRTADPRPLPPAARVPAGGGRLDGVRDRRDTTAGSPTTRWPTLSSRVGWSS